MATQPKKGSSRLSYDVTRPQPTGAGDAPADTLDATEFATSASSNKGAAADGGFQSVNAVIPESRPTFGGGASADRKETYQQVSVNGVVETVTHDLVTGKTTVGGESGGQPVNGGGQGGGSFTNPPTDGAGE